MPNITQPRPSGPISTKMNFIKRYTSLINASGALVVYYKSKTTGKFAGRLVGG
jgi:hypothetical protein